MQDRISQEKLEKYFSVTTTALNMAKNAPVVDEQKTKIVLEMASCYVDDASWFKENGDIDLAFGALNYAHGWLDCGARLGFFIVTDDNLFTVDHSRSRPSANSE